MPILAGLLVALFDKLLAYFAQYFTKKVALGLSAVAIFAGLTTALMVTLKALITGAMAFLPSYPGMEVAAWVAVPGNLVPALSACIATDSAVALYRWNVENLKILAYIT